MNPIILLVLTCAAVGQTFSPIVDPLVPSRPTASDETVVAIKAGDGPGYFFYDDIPDNNFRPRYFTVGFDGRIFLLADPQERLHVFGPDGKLRGIIRLNRPRTSVRVNGLGLLAVTADGLLHVTYNGEVGKAIGVFDQEGHFLTMLGPKGALPSTDWAAGMNVHYAPRPNVAPIPSNLSSTEPVSPATRAERPSAFADILGLSSSEDGALIVLGRRTHEVDPEAFVIEGSPRAVRQSSEAMHILDEAKDRFHACVNGLKARAETMGGSEKQDWEFATSSSMFVAPDNCLYYMVVTPEILEIHRVRFKDEPGTGSESSIPANTQSEP